LFLARLDFALVGQPLVSDRPTICSIASKQTADQASSPSHSTSLDLLRELLLSAVVIEV
jgi:hypothetical protein